MMTTFEVEVRSTVKVTLDETKFTPEFMAEFRKSFFPLYELSDHACHIAQLAAREVYSFNRRLPDEFAEGYGPIGAMGISAEVIGGDEQVLSSADAGERS